jgi:hypothetical protein
MLAGSKELECDHGITGVKVRVAVGANKASAVFSAAFIDQSWPGDQARRNIAHMGVSYKPILRLHDQKSHTTIYY